MDSYNSQEGRSVEELKVIIKKVLENNYQAFEEVSCLIGTFSVRFSWKHANR